MTLEERKPIEEQIHQLKLLISASKKIVAFTGAGISAESGIPTYRDSGGLWTKYDPDKYVSIDYFRHDPTYFWNFFRDVRLTAVKTAEPNAAHYALAKLEAEGRLISVVTQNIDGLHQMAGSNLVRELHGNTTRFTCFHCGQGYNLPQVEKLLGSMLVPRCSECSGPLRPDVVLFGELLPESLFESSLREALTCDLILAIGSSLVVWPAADIPNQAKRNGASLVILNLDPTPLDSIADLVIHASASVVLSGAVE